MPRLPPRNSRPDKGTIIGVPVDCHEESDCLLPNRYVEMSVFVGIKDPKMAPKNFDDTSLQTNWGDTWKQSG